MADVHALGPDLLVVCRWSTHLLLGEQPFPQCATRDSPHRLKVPFALRTLSEYGELDGCTPLGSLSAPLAAELYERGHRASLSGHGTCLTQCGSRPSGQPGGQETRKPPRLKRLPRVHSGRIDRGVATVDAPTALPRSCFASTATKQRFRMLRECSEPSQRPQSRRDAEYGPPTLRFHLWVLQLAFEP